MLPPDHVAKSFFRIYQKAPQFVLDNWLELYILLWELHCWFDRFSNTKGYNTVYTIAYHREQTHHREGIDEAIRLFCCKYDHRYWIMIEQEAEQHVLDDFGEIPSKSNVTRRYLREKRGW